MIKKVLLLSSIIVILVYSIYNLNIKNSTNIYLKGTSDIVVPEGFIIKNGTKNQKIIAITFDDGPHEKFTPQILDILKANDAKATFFVVGNKVEAYPDIVKRIKEEGHEIGNHTYNHINAEKHNKSKVEDEILKGQEAVYDITGTKPTLFRPPYKGINQNLINIVSDLNLKFVLWCNTVDVRDWSNPGVYSISNKLLNNIQNGDIILLHDYNNREKLPTSQTVQALRIVIPELKKRGYEFVTVSQLIKITEEENKKTKENKKQENKDIKAINQ